MCAAWEAVEKSGFPMAKTAKVFGKFQIRLVLHLLDKEVKGREGTKYESFEDIKNRFEDDLLQADKETAAVSAPEAKAVSSQSVKSLMDAKDTQAIALAAHKHIQLGKLYVHKKEKEETKVWKLTGFIDGGAKFVHKPFFRAAEEITVLHSDWNDWKEYKKPEPELVSHEVSGALLPCSSKGLDGEMARAQAQWELYEKCREFLASMLSFLSVCVCFPKVFEPLGIGAQAGRSKCSGLQPGPSVCKSKGCQRKAMFASNGQLAIGGGE